MKTKIILGLGYGDEGKGLVTGHHAAQAASSGATALVVRFSGGHQAGHTVVSGSQRHVCSSFGSGALVGVPTYWSRYCTLDPVAYWREWQALMASGLNPTSYIDALAPVTTPYDVFANQNRERKLQHGSCGMGVGETYARNEGPHKLYAQDLYYPTALHLRLQSIRQYYAECSGLPEDWQEKEALFLYAVEEIREQLQLVREREFFRTVLFDEYLFEGSQGILLDMDHGFFPHVTRSYTTSRQALELVRANNLPQPTIYYVTRAYQTRHGAGPFTYEDAPLQLKPRPLETNRYNEWQGIQRCAPLDAELLNYALAADDNYSTGCPKHLVVTCLDQLDEALPLMLDGERLALQGAVNLPCHLEYSFAALWESWSNQSGELMVGSKDASYTEGNIPYIEKF